MNRLLASALLKANFRSAGFLAYATGYAGSVAYLWRKESDTRATNFLIAFAWPFATPLFFAEGLEFVNGKLAPAVQPSAPWAP